MQAPSKIQKLVMQRKAHGAQAPRQYIQYGEWMSTAQRSDAYEEWVCGGCCRVG